ncbi:hypothetical protein PsYK624_101930 [Phanerochaete sordida]|uniref:Kinetochore protein mis14 n=1 Tax=Phanerochaete sordida TaxID=48140 RepID=A0A9P3GFN9_9APHY|nr:hypothetical protein PsYK624_101930 [Phanerochaete sordida]
MDAKKEREDVPRVAVDNLHDWARIRKSYADTARAQLEVRLARERRTPAEQERLRATLDAFIERAFEMCKPNLRVNGRNFEELDADEQGGIEPFDEGLDRHIWSLSDQRLQWDGEIARKRREKPAEVQRLMQELLETQRAVDDAEAEEYAAVQADEGASAPAPDLPEEVYAQVEDTARRTFALVDELQQSVRLQHERSERLKVATAEVKNLKP